MKRNTISVAFGMLLLAAPQFAAARQFEGVIKQRSITVSVAALADRGIDESSILDLPIERLLALQGALTARGDMTVTEMEIYIKGRRFRSDEHDEDGSAYATTDLDQGVVRIVRPGERMYIEMTLDDMRRMASSGGGAAATPDVSETGATRSIHGMAATAYDVASYDGTTRVWVSNDDANLTASFAQFAEALEAMSMGDDPDPSMAVANLGFPVLTQTLTYDTYDIDEVVAVDSRTVDDAIFAVPAGYRKMTMADMMGGMMPSADSPASASAPVGGDESDQFVEYTVSGAADLNGREEDVTMCSELEDGLAARTLGEWYFTLEANGAGPGRHETDFHVVAPHDIEALNDASQMDNSFTGPGIITVEAAGKGQLGLDIIRIRFSATGLESDAGRMINVEGTMACPVM